MKYIIKEVPYCFCCPNYEFNHADMVHWCNEMEMILEVDVNTIDPDCPLPDSISELTQQP